MRRTFSLSCPPSSKPTYPGGEPIILETECPSMYSDISTLISAFSEPNIASASVLLSSVLPTPVGPKNRKEPMGLPGSFNPTLPLRIALATAFTASSCPITRLCRTDSSFKSRSLSFSASFFTGIFVHIETTSAISFSPTVYSLLFSCSSKRRFILSYFLRSTSCWRFKSPACSKFSMRMERSICMSFSCIFRKSSRCFSGTRPVLRRTAAAASSIKSIALSGRFLSLIYLSESFAAATIASGSIFTLWWASYLALMPFKIRMAASTSGSSTFTG